MTSGTRVVIVGGGAAGILVAIHLAARGAGRPGSRIDEIVVVEPAERLGEGIAYGTRSASHLLNVRAGGMSAFPDRPAHFTGWVRGTGRAVGGSEFLPRMLYAPYLRDTLAEASAASAASEGTRDARVRHVRARVTAIDLTQGHDTHLTLSDTTELSAGEVVLATGNGLAPLSWLPDLPGVIRDPWVPGALDALDGDARVVIVGSGLSAVDVVVSLRDREHRGLITSVSSHGLLPRVHASAELPPRAPVMAGRTPGVRGLLHALRADASRADDWRQTIDGVRSATVATWRALPIDERRRALRHGARHWEVHRHRMAPEIAAVVDMLRADGRLAVVRGRVRSIVRDDAGALAVRARSGGVDRMLAADVVIACVGPSADPMHDPLLARAVADGSVVRHPLGLGLDVDDSGRARWPDGSVQPHLWTTGSLRRGADWESTAVPELRQHAAAIAEAINAAH